MQRGARPAVRAARPALRAADLSAAPHNPVDITDVVLDTIFLEESVAEPGGEWTQRKGAVTAEGSSPRSFPVYSLDLPLKRK
ncbi:hypothetical protein JEQ12_003292 [Ovis aries]|uniref:Uncharacterized protein n=1 Tax=Ovis aries TaxID=9940 RepID=A0A836A9P9_SHEEP|nr:hypothetical protein JEQ12_003292 [Ovis aries]